MFCRKEVLDFIFKCAQSCCVFIYIWRGGGGGWWRVFTHTKKKKRKEKQIHKTQYMNSPHNHIYFPARRGLDRRVRHCKNNKATIERKGRREVLFVRRKISISIVYTFKCWEFLWKHVPQYYLNLFIIALCLYNNLLLYIYVFCGWQNGRYIWNAIFSEIFAGKQKKVPLDCEFRKLIYILLCLLLFFFYLPHNHPVYSIISVYFNGKEKQKKKEDFAYFVHKDARGR